MNDHASQFGPERVRDDFVPKDAYHSRDFAELERERLWPRVWQIACREEELPEPGDYVTYDILDDSIIVVRNEQGEVAAFHNVCVHRGRRLTEGCGHLRQFVCRFHGWRYSLDGAASRVVDREDWGDTLQPEDLRLAPVRCATWGGFVFINMDPDAEPLEAFLDPVPAFTDKFEFEKLRFRWYKTVIMAANWKTVLGFFSEFYHVQQAHPQLLEFTDDYSISTAFGRHARISFAGEGAVPFRRSPRLPPADEPSLKQHIVAFAEVYRDQLGAMLSERHYEAVQQLRHAVPDDAPNDVVMAKWVELQMAAAEEDGAGWPAELTPEYIESSGLDWHLFPNTIFLHGFVDGVLWYRVRPNGDDPDSCIFDIWALDRYAPGKEPKLNREFYADWREADWGRIFEQDFVNIPEVQRGLKSRGYQGDRTNPVQERAISNFHRELRRFMQD